MICKHRFAASQTHLVYIGHVVSVSTIIILYIYIFLYIYRYIYLYIYIDIYIFIYIYIDIYIFYVFYFFNVKKTTDKRRKSGERSGSATWVCAWFGRPRCWRYLSLCSCETEDVRTRENMEHSLMSGALGYILPHDSYQLLCTHLHAWLQLKCC